MTKINDLAAQTVLQDKEMGSPEASIICWAWILLGFFFIWVGGSDTFLHKVKVKVKDGFKLGEGRERKPPSYMITRTTEIYLVVIVDELSMHLLEWNKEHFFSIKEAMYEKKLTDACVPILYFLTRRMPFFGSSGVQNTWQIIFFHFFFNMSEDWDQVDEKEEKQSWWGVNNSMKYSVLIEEGLMWFNS